MIELISRKAYDRVGQPGNGMGIGPAFSTKPWAPLTYHLSKEGALLGREWRHGEEAL
jgi:hypothetical protein